jgi:hypothetical protein
MNAFSVVILVSENCRDVLIFGYLRWSLKSDGGLLTCFSQSFCHQVSHHSARRILRVPADGEVRSWWSCGGAHPSEDGKASQKGRGPFDARAGTTKRMEGNESTASASHPPYDK